MLICKKSVSETHTQRAMSVTQQQNPNRRAIEYFSKSIYIGGNIAKEKLPNTPCDTDL